MSRFISAGTEDKPSEHDEAWQKAQQEIEAKKLQKAQAGQQEGGKSLYETLQANKGDSSIVKHELYRHTPLTSQDDEPPNKKLLRKPTV
jgi:hypothetical protein